MNLEGNTILITGGGSGIGLALAKGFAELGNHVLICGRDEEKLRQAAGQVPALTPIPCDIADADSVQRLLERLKAEFPAFNVLVNNAAVQFNYDFTSPDDHTQVIDQEIQINLNAAVRLTDRVIPLLLRQPRAAIINLTSALAVAPKASAPLYCATKAGLRAFTKALRYQLEKTPIQVFEILPPLVDTPMTQGRGSGKMSPEELARHVFPALRRNRYEIRVGKTRLLMVLHRLAPGWMEARMGKA